MKIEEKCCGCIVFDGQRVLLVKQNNGQWGFPKGHVEHDEDEEETARREIQEETNLSIYIDTNKRYVMQYVTDKGKNKEVVLFVAKKVGGELVKQEDEVEELRWVDMYDVADMLTFENARELYNDVLRDNF